MTATSTPQSGYAPVNGLQLYYEIHGDGAPLILLHGGGGATGMFGVLLPTLTASRQVIAVDLQAHGRTADIDRPLRIEHMADDIAALIAHLGLTTATVMGYSLGGAVALQTAIRHPQQVEKLIVVSTPYKRDGWYAEGRAGMDQMGAGAAEFLKQSPMYEMYSAIAPRVEDWPVLWEKMGDLLRQDYNWSDGVAALAMPTMIIFGDADSVSPIHAAEFFVLLGGGKVDGGWDRSGMTPHRLAILPDTTHYDIFSSPALAAAVAPFLATPLPAAK
jgi:pimeloyl-ACP methyl ester carboxylesterase